MRIGIYGPYFGIMGGGELYLGTIAEVLSRDYQVDLVSESDISPTAFQKFFGLDLSRVQIRKIPQIPFVESLNPLFPERSDQYLENSRFTQEYDLFIIMPRNFRIPFRTTIETEHFTFASSGSAMEVCRLLESAYIRKIFGIAK